MIMTKYLHLNDNNSASVGLVILPLVSEPFKDTKNHFPMSTLMGFGIKLHASCILH